MTSYGKVGEGQSRFGQLAWAFFMLLGILLIGLVMAGMSWIIPGNPLAWNEAAWTAVGGLLVAGGFVWMLLTGLSKQIVLLQRWGEPLVHIEEDGLRIPLVMAGTLLWSDDAAIEISAVPSGFSDDKPASGTEPHVIISLREARKFRHHGLPLLGVSKFNLPTPDPAALAAAIVAHPGYRGAGVGPSILTLTLT